MTTMQKVMRYNSRREFALCSAIIPPRTNTLNAVPRSEGHDLSRQRIRRINANLLHRAENVRALYNSRRKKKATAVVAKRKQHRHYYRCLSSLHACSWRGHRYGVLVIDGLGSKPGKGHCLGSRLLKACHKISLDCSELARGTGAAAVATASAPVRRVGSATHGLQYMFFTKTETPSALRRLIVRKKKMERGGFSLGDSLRSMKLVETSSKLNNTPVRSCTKTANAPKTEVYAI